MVVSAPKRLDNRPIFQSRYDNFIGGKWIAPHNRQYSDNLSPVTGKPLCQVPDTVGEFKKHIQGAIANFWFANF
jgi:aldehyde dehydrogenase